MTSQTEYNKIDPANDIVLLNHNDIVTEIDGTAKGINPIPSFGLVKGISSEVSAIAQEYFKLSADNDVSGHNTFNGKQDFNGVASVQDVEVRSSLSVDFGNVLNTKDEYLSALHTEEQIKTINNIYRIVDEIEVEAGINENGIDYSIDLGTLVGVEIKESIIHARELELFGVPVSEASSTDPLKVFYDTATASTDLDTVVGALKEILKRLKIAKYTLQQKIQSIEKSIDALEVNLQEDIGLARDDAAKACEDVERLSGDIAAISGDYELASGPAVSVITSLNQRAGKVTIEAHRLVSSDVFLLDGLVADSAAAVREYADSKFLPLAGGTLAGNLAIERDYGLSVRDGIESISANGQTLREIVDNSISLSTDAAVKKLSSDLKDDFGFGYDIESNMISAHVAGKTLQFSASKFTEARMLDSVHVIYATGKPYLELKFKTDVAGSYTVVSVDLMEIMPLYIGNDGIDIQYDTDIGKYVVSADETIARQGVIDNLSAVNTIQPGMILSSLAQENGKISYSTMPILSSYVNGLSDYIGFALSTFNMPLSAIYTSWTTSPSSVNDKAITIQDYVEDQKLYFVPCINGNVVQGTPKTITDDPYSLTWQQNELDGELSDLPILQAERSAVYYVLGNHTDKPIQPAGDYATRSELSLSVDTLLDTIDTVSTDLSDAVANNYVHISGDMMDGSLSIANGNAQVVLSTASGTTSYGSKITVNGNELSFPMVSGTIATEEWTLNTATNLSAIYGKSPAAYSPWMDSADPIHGAVIEGPTLDYTLGSPGDCYTYVIVSGNTIKPILRRMNQAGPDEYVITDDGEGETRTIPASATEMSWTWNELGVEWPGYYDAEDKDEVAFHCYRAPVTSYCLGAQSDKLLQPAGNYLDGSATLNGISLSANPTISADSIPYKDNTSISIALESMESTLQQKSAVSVDSILADVNMVHISQDAYAQLVATSAVLSNTLYVVSSDCIDAYGQKIRNVEPGSDLSDVATVGQLKDYADNHLSSIVEDSAISAFFDAASTNIGSVSIASAVSALFSLVKLLAKK